MGCDIHMLAETYNDETKTWEFVNNKFIDNWIFERAINHLSDFFGITKKESKHVLMCYVNKKSSRNKLFKKIIDDYLPMVLNLDSDKWGENTSTFIANFMTSSVYIGRNYTLFGVLNQVRSYHEDTITDINRGLPLDVSNEIKEESDSWGGDAHSHTHIYLNEILDSKYYKFTNSKLDSYGLGRLFFRDSVKALKKLNKDYTKVRIVFWFDN